MAAAAAASLREEHPEGTGIPVVSDGTAAQGDGAEPSLAPLTGDAALAAERLEDLRRLQAEYVNYKKRVDRDRSVARDQGISHVLESMLPVLDEIHLAREHGDLGEGPAATIVDKLEAVLAKLGIERFGAAGDEFDPNHHEALMRMEADLPEGATTTTVVQVLQPGYRLGERIVRAARVAVADPQ
ncbi:MAG: nucleotide exchange factor GrpE [Actinomycetales bacterium]|uniref:Protein GrpE n=1 Tax=Candidatus Phosphoribacter hodrii TaxID=2953743 RepID=A0A935CE81_9MICO|nr:nucleotide exchange factor GrpE [Candidatus Phosphoribacter hodrii]MBK7272209.1 nucleotide exchange factor GrpE [Candidatus Phosphoribacter hodrii]